MRRVARAVVLGLWTAFFAYLWVTGEMSRYLGPRTYWVVAFGTIALAIATLLHIMTLRTRRQSQRPSLGEAVSLVVLVIPALVVAVTPRAGLGALAAARKASVGSLGSIAAPEPRGGGEISFLEIQYASESQQYATSAGIGDGYDVELVGFVTDDPGGAEPGFELTRFYVSCCAADALPYSVSVSSERDYAADTWLKVSGALSRRDDAYVLVPDTITEVKEPENPYLY